MVDGEKGPRCAGCPQVVHVGEGGNQQLIMCSCGRMVSRPDAVAVAP